jgi:hypothetical protein
MVDAAFWMRALSRLVPQEYEVESGEHHDDADIHNQSFQEVVSEECEICTDYDGYHHHGINHDERVSVHFSYDSFRACASCGPRPTCGFLRYQRGRVAQCGREVV